MSCVRLDLTTGQTYLCPGKSGPVVQCLCVLCWISTIMKLSTCEFHLTRLT